MPMCASRAPRRAEVLVMALSHQGERENLIRFTVEQSSAKRLIPMSNAVAVTDADFEQEIEKHDGLAVVDFWATWCGPCRMIAPILDQLPVEYGGRGKGSH